MQRLLIFVLSSFATISNANCQQISIENILTREIKKIAKEATKINVDSLAPILDLKKQETKIRRFELENCEFYTKIPETVNYNHATPAGEFPSIKDVPESISTFSNRTLREVTTI